MTTSLPTLPWKQDPTDAAAGWLISATVKESSVAQRGRFALQDIKEGEVVRRCPLVPASEGRADVGTVIAFESGEEIEKFWGRFPEVEGEETPLEHSLHFTGFPKNNGGRAVLWVPSCYLNHGVAAVEQRVVGDHVHMVAVRDIKEGEEMFLDYREMQDLPWYKEWHKATGRKVLTNEMLGLQVSGPLEQTESA